MGYVYWNKCHVKHTIVLYVYGIYHLHLRKRSGRSERIRNSLDDWNVVIIREWWSMMDFFSMHSVEMTQPTYRAQTRTSETFSLFLSLSLSLSRFLEFTQAHALFTALCSVAACMARILTSLVALHYCILMRMKCIDKGVATYVSYFLIL